MQKSGTVDEEMLGNHNHSGNNLLVSPLINEKSLQKSSLKKRDVYDSASGEKRPFFQTSSEDNKLIGQSPSINIVQRQDDSLLEPNLHKPK